MKNSSFLGLGYALLLTSCGNSSQAPQIRTTGQQDAVATLAEKLPAGYRMVTEHGKPEKVLVVWKEIKDYQDIDRIAGDDADYKDFLQKSWTQFEEKAPAAELRKNYKGTPITSQDTGYCYVSVSTFSNLPINNIVSGRYESQCMGAGNATVVYGNHTLHVKNNTSNQSNFLTHTSTNGNIYYLGAPVRMSFGGHLYCARGYHASRTLDGNTFSHDTQWLCDYWFT